MNKKKILLTVLLSILLAFVVALCLHRITTKQKCINNQPSEKITIQEQKTTNTDNLEQENVKAKNSASRASKTLTPVSEPVVKEKILQKHDELTTNIENSSKNIEDSKEENELHQENGVIIPVNYVSKNIYRYTYTPKRYPKQKL